MRGRLEYSGDIILFSEVDQFDLDLDWKKLLRSEPEEVGGSVTRTGRPRGSADFAEEAENLSGCLLAPRSATDPRKYKEQLCS